MCPLLGLSQDASMFFSSFSIVLIAVDRCLYICHIQHTIPANMVSTKCWQRGRFDQSSQLTQLTWIPRVVDRRNIQVNEPFEVAVAFLFFFSPSPTLLSSSSRKSPLPWSSPAHSQDPSYSKFSVTKRLYNHKCLFVCLSVHYQNPQAYILHLSSFTFHPSPFILHLSSFIFHPSSFILHLSSSIFHPSSFIHHLSSFIFHPSSLILHSFIHHFTTFKLLSLFISIFRLLKKVVIFFFSSSCEKWHLWSFCYNSLKSLFLSFQCLIIHKTE